MKIIYRYFFESFLYNDYFTRDKRIEYIFYRNREYIDFFVVYYRFGLYRFRKEANFIYLKFLKNIITRYSTILINRKIISSKE